MDLSIIIPVYNSEKYLFRCLNSIVGQLREGVELILIDDGSTDKSSKICDDYANFYKHIQVKHQINMGVSAARNKGIHISKGRWLTFVDADDFVSASFVDKILSYVSDNLELILFEYDKADGRNKDIRYKREKKNIDYGESDRDSFIRANFMSKGITGSDNIDMRSVWAKAYNRKLLERIDASFFEGVKMGEDMLFTLEVYNNFHHAIVVSEKIYSYFFNNGDSATNQYKPDLENIVQSYVDAIKPWLNKNIQYEAYYAAYRLNDIILYMKYDFFHKKNIESKKDLYGRMKRIFLDGGYSNYYLLAKKNCLLSDFYDLGKRIVFWLALHGHFRLLRIIAYIKYGT